VRLVFGLVVFSVVGFGAPKLRVSGNLIYNAGDESLRLTAASADLWLTTRIEPASGCPQPECYRLITVVGPGVPSVGEVVSSVVISDPNAIDSPQVITVPVRNGAYDIPDRLEFWVRYEAPDSGVTPESETRDICTVVVNVKIPEEAETGTVEVWISIDGVETNRVLCAIV